MKLRLLPEKKPTVATVTISPSADPELTVLEVAYGHALLTVVVDAVEVRDLRAPKSPAPRKARSER